eukprot:gnl/Hemi2/17629_TR5817_c0_g1_i1.p1 gnl/Hemi2/17629_TR5817_c0_g1~~gnl/Hemi2/17629_TR5817_c0_g1_i1.p1  ORF type:complete len:411 (-),score=146.70 gnl/Hemi2/17629_TR5817_c0_g1_i1:160-1392(-)
MMMKQELSLLLLCVVGLVSVAAGASVTHRRQFFIPAGNDSCPDCSRNVSQMVIAAGYPCEEHSVTTEDGYILSMQRIPYGISGRTSGKRPVVLLQHGLLDSAHTWVNLGPGHALGYILADAGFEVWLGNNRGSLYSKKHVSLDPNSLAFWQFSWDEMGRYDMPSMIDYALQVSGASSLGYVGHSEGTIQAFAGFSITPAYNSKVNLFVALAPIANVGNLTSEFLRALIVLQVPAIVELFGQKQFLPDPWIMKEFDPIFCSVAPDLCDNLLFAICGTDKKDLNATVLPVLVAHAPAGTSVQNMLHWVQGVKYGGFKMYDFGADDNKKHYNQTTPPDYNLAKVSIPLFLVTGTQDALGDPTDEAWLMQRLPPGFVVHNEPTYEHLDFVWGTDAHIKIYPLVQQQLLDHAASS